MKIERKSHSVIQNRTQRQIKKDTQNFIYFGHNQSQPSIKKTNQNQEYWDANDENRQMQHLMIMN